VWPLPIAIIPALGPRVETLRDTPAWQIIHETPGVDDLWQLHFAVAGGKEHNSSDTLLANVDEACEGKWLKMTVKPDGSYTVENSRNKFQKTYAHR